MPEGPEIRIAADRIARVLEGRRIDDVQLLSSELHRFESILKGATVTRVDTRGKAMLTRFSNGLTLYSHNQLYGRWYVSTRGDLPKTNRSLRVAIHTKEHSAMLYSATDVEILDAKGIESHPFLNRIGPDILDPSLTQETIVSRLEDKRFKGRMLASLYLDQAFLAGVGNYLRSEILYFAGLDFQRSPRDLSAKEKRHLARETLAVSRRSYRTRGTTNTPSRVGSRKQSGDTLRDAYRYAVFARAGKPCDDCQTIIERAVAGSRRIYFCPRCQPTSTNAG